MQGQSTQLLVGVDWFRHWLHALLILLTIACWALVVLVFFPKNLMAWGFSTFLLGWVCLFVAGVIKQRWEVGYKGHRIQFESSPLFGQKLFVDNAMAAKGSGFGSRNELRCNIDTGEGEDEQVVVSCLKGLAFRCRITAVSSGTSN